MKQHESNAPTNQPSKDCDQHTVEQPLNRNPFVPIKPPKDVAAKQNCQGDEDTEGVDGDGAKL